MEKLSLNDKEGALQTFHEAVISKLKGSITTLDDIMKQHVKLCVDLENFKLLREVLPIYRNAVQINSPQSLKDLLEVLQDCTSGKVAVGSPDTLAALDDLDGEGDLTMVMTQDTSRSEASALKFLWETYKLCIDLLKTNGKLVDTYRNMATKALTFCEEKKRKVECIRLCENLRIHLINVIKNHRNQTSTNFNYVINLDDEETVSALMKLKRKQIETCISLELYQEAYKAIEDAYQLSLLQETLAPSFKSWYYHMASTTLLKGKHWRCHSYVYFLYLSVNMKANKKLAAEEKTEMCTQFLVSAMAIPVNDPPEVDLTAKLETLLWDSHIPERSHLLEKLAVSVLPFVTPWAKDLYTLMHEENLPKDLVAKVKPLLEHLRCPELESYVPNIEQLVISKVVDRLVKSYTSITFKSFTKIVDFIEFSQIETHMLELSKKSGLHILIDKAKQAFFFKEHECSLIHRLSAAHKLLNELSLIHI